MESRRPFIVMADFKIKSARDSGDDSEARRRVEFETRKEMRIETLAEDEELIDDTLFSKMHEDLVLNKAGPDSAKASEDSAEGSSEIDELLLVEVISEIPADRAVQEGHRERIEPAPDSPGEVAHLEMELQRAADRDAVVRVALRLGRRFVRVAALFVVNQGVIAGIRGEGEGLEERIEGVMISSSLGGVFGEVANSGKTCYKRAPYGEAMDQRVLSALGRGQARELLLVPITIRGRVVSLLYGDNGDDLIPETSIAGLRTLALIIAHTYERLIINRKHASPG